MQPPEEIVPAERERITAADRRLVAAALAVVILSSFYVWHNYRAAFPQASLHLSLSRTEITARAQAFLASRGFSPASYRQVTLFDPDDEARLFLEREAGLDQANRLMESDVSVWRWKARWYKPPQKEEFIVLLWPDGRIAAFDHVLADEAPGARMSAAQARVIADEFLKTQTPLAHHLVEEHSEQKPNRDDHLFTFERDAFRVQSATYRRSITIRGDAVAASAEYLYVPEQWKRDFAALRSKNQLFSQIAQAFYAVLACVAFIVLMQGMRRRQIHWRPLVRACLVIAALNVVSDWNGLLFRLADIPTSTPYLEAVALALLEGIGGGVGAFFYVIFAAAPGEPLYRRAWPRFLQLGYLWSRRGIQSREFFRATITGYAFAAAHIAFLVAFYLIGRRFGVWSPQDVEYSDLLSTWLPWIYPLTASLLAATSEESWFRLLAIPLLLGATRSRAVAVIVPALVWGFLHSNYPQQPGYIRGVEVGLIGIAAGIIFLRFGLLATLVWHYTVDAGLMGSFLLQSPGWYYRLSGALVTGVVLIPLGLSLWNYRRRGGFLADPALANQFRPVVEPVREQTVQDLDGPLPPVWSPRLLYLVAAILAAGALLVPSTRYGSFLRVSLTRAQALEIAGPPSPGWMVYAEFLPNLSAENFEYLRRQSGAAQADRIVENYTITGAWRVRYFKPLQKEERFLYIDRDGKVFRTDHVLDEKAPGAKLSPDAARRIAEQHVATRHSIDTRLLTLVDSSQEQRDHRTDHSFVWEDPSLKAGEAKARISLDILGDEPSRFRRYLHLPEHWTRDFHRIRFQAYLLPAVGGGFALMLLIVFLRHLSDHPLRWRLYIAGAITAAILTAAAYVNDWPGFYESYNTAQPLADYTSDTALRIVLSIVFVAFAVFVGALGCDVFLRLAQGARSPGPLAAPQILAFAAIFWAFSRILGGIEQWIPGDRLSLPLWSPPDVTAWSPALSVLFSAARNAIVGTLVATAVVSAFYALFTPRRRLAYVLMVAVCSALGRAISPGLLAFHFITVLVAYALIVVVVRTSAAAIPSFALALFLSLAARGSLALATEPAFAGQGILTAAAAVVIVCVAGFSAQGRWRRSSPP